MKYYFEFYLSIYIYIYTNKTNKAGYQTKNMNWSYGYSYGRNDRARSVATSNFYDDETASNQRKNYLKGRNSVGRFNEDYNDSVMPATRTSTSYKSRAINSPFSSSSMGAQKKLQPSTSNSNKLVERSSGYTYNTNKNSLDKRTDEIEMRMSLAEENSITPTPENLD